MLSTSPDPVGCFNNHLENWPFLASEKPQEFPLTAHLTSLRDLLETGGGRGLAGHVPCHEEKLHLEETDWQLASCHTLGHWSSVRHLNVPGPLHQGLAKSPGVLGPSTLWSPSSTCHQRPLPPSPTSFILYPGLLSLGMQTIPLRPILSLQGPEQHW